MNDTNSITKVPLSLADELVKYIRLLAKTGRKMFHTYLFAPLENAEWKRSYSNETIRKMMDRIDKACEHENTINTAAPLCKRLISLSITEGYSALGDCSIYFLEKMTGYLKISTAPEAIQFIEIIKGPLFEFIDIHQNKSEEIFSNYLSIASRDELKSALAPVDLGKHQMRIQLKKEAYNLFKRITLANQNNDIARCRKLIAAFLINYGDQEDNNREEVDKFIEAFESKYPDFRKDLNNAIAVDLYYKIIGGITDGKLKKTIQAIRKYAYIFQGNPETLFFQDIDKMEGKLYAIIKEKDLWDELKKS